MGHKKHKYGAQKKNKAENKKEMCESIYQVQDTVCLAA